jgi:glucose/arabinose dehydrogenase
VYSIGHRNPQGLDWDSQDQLWATEHGRSGVRSGYDELNRIEKGKNYGWPTIEGDATKSGLERPVQHSGPSTTWAPADIAIIGNTLYFGGLRGQSLYETALSGTSTGAIKANFGQTYGRIRALTVYDGYLYFATSNQDGRGEPQSGDDKILRLKLNQ